MKLLYSSLKCCRIFYRQLQQPQTSQERRELNKLLLKCLQLLSGVMHAHINKLHSQQLQVKDDVEFVHHFNRKYEAEVKPIQDALIDMNAHKKVNYVKYVIYNRIHLIKSC